MSDRDRVDRFLRRVDELHTTRLVRSGALSNAFHLGARAGQPPVMSVSVPDEDDFRSFLMAFRHLVATKEPSNFDRIANLLFQDLTPGRLRDFVVECREQWRHDRKTGTIRLEIDGQDFGPERTLDLYLNGRYFHSEEAKARDLNSVGEFGQRLTRHQLNGLLVAGVNYARHLEWTILTGRSEGLLSC